MISPLASSTPTRGSRSSSLITPQRPRSAHRTTPYSTTTSRALMRAKISKDATIDRESELISTETTYETTTTSVKQFKYTMSGARGSLREDAQAESDEQEEQGDAEDDKEDDQEFSITPSRNIFSRTTTPSKTPTKSPKKESQVPETGKKTWGQWLGAILPASVKKPVKAILGDPAEFKSTEQEVHTPKKETPAQDYDFDDNEEFSLPGSFGKAPPSPLRTPSQPPSKREQRKIEMSYETPSRDGLFAYQKPKTVIAPRTLPPPSRRIIPTLAPSSKTPGRSASASVAPGSSYHRPSNFIERMKSAKRSNRYDPYSRPKGTSSRAKKTSPEPSEPTELTAEEELELLERREKERKVQEAEDRYLKREIRKKLGQEEPEQDGDGDSEMSDTETSSQQPSVEEVVDEGEPSERSPPASPAPKSPVKQSVPTPSSPPTGPAPTFLFGNPSSPPPTTTTTTAPAAPEPAAAPTTWSFSSDSDKENISSGPPPPPTMSHAQLPAPLTTSSHPPAIAGGLLGTYHHQPDGGFGLGLGLPKESTPLNRQRSAAEKFKPHVSSGLRESSTVDEEKENEKDVENKRPLSFGYDKENASSSSSSGGKLGGSSSGGGVGGGLTMQSVFKTSGALKENERVLNLGKSDAKVDLRAKIEAVCSLPFLSFIGTEHGTNVISQLQPKQLECGVSWPTLSQPFGGKDVCAAVESMFNTVDFPQGFDGEMFGLAVHVDL
ncbi:hypothetical protein L873DRAFT_1808148 [Choiromyces venosus 120613-1]|uniref:Uncharacterized protein n=1 Tax=Choiromyces venosus 120613-1 TaxID=1336337 RepID=A0A3N4JJW5_9PEZI|nr:hypothetical protein L873DRAFT_1808148 [Choiromyces venosus 120613-1]